MTFPKSLLLNLAGRLPRRMWTQLAAVLVALVAVPIVALGWRLVYLSQDAVRTSVLRDREQLAVRAAGEIGQFLKRPRGLLVSTAAILGTLHSDLWKQETALVELALDEPSFGRIASVDPDGREIAVSQIGTPLGSRAREPVFREAMRGRFAVSDVTLSADHVPSILMAAPIRRLGKITGVLMAEVSLRGLWDIVDGIRLGRTGRAYVVSQKGVLIAHEDKKKVLANEDFSPFFAVRAALAGKTGSREETEAGARWLTAYAPVSETRWALIVRQSVREAYAFLYGMIAEAWVLLVFSLVATVLASLFLSRVLVRRIRLLAEKMALVAQGRLDQRLPVGRRDEMGELIDGFNRMAEKLQHAREEEKLAMLGKAAAGIAHELKNSVLMTSTLIGLLPQRRDDARFLDKFISVVPQELDGWKSMLQDISDFSRKSRYEFSRVDLKHLIADFCVLAEQRLAQGGVRLQCRVDDDLPRVTGNAGKLKHILMNLTINALEAMPDGGIVELTACRAGSEVEVRVTDSGKGIPPAEMGRIFEPFHTTKANGLGLGLAICREIVERHGGRIEARGGAEKGTTFVFYLTAERTRS